MYIPIFKNFFLKIRIFISKLGKKSPKFHSELGRISAAENTHIKSLTMYIFSQNGEIKCKKNCTPEHELPCKHPQKHNGDCCKQCPDSKTKDGKRNRKDRRRKNKGKGNKRRRHRKDCKDKANKSEHFEQTSCAFSVISPECIHKASLKFSDLRPHYMCFGMIQCNKM